MSESCRNCRFWKEFTEEEDPSVLTKHVLESGDAEGRCRRYPPKIDVASRIFESSQWESAEEAADALADLITCHDCRFPTTLSSEWCGEYQTEKKS